MADDPATRIALVLLVLAVALAAVLLTVSGRRLDRRVAALERAERERRARLRADLYGGAAAREALLPPRRGVR